MRLVPTPERVQLVGFSLAAALAHFPGGQVLAICQMSNHLHLVLRDNNAELSDLMQYFLSHLAKRINRLDRMHGAVFERRFSEITIVDDIALLARIAYAVANPVEAALVRTHRDWTGLCMFAGRVAWKRTFSHFQQGRYERALQDAPGDDSASVSRSEFYETAVLEVGAVDRDLATAIAEAINAREADLRHEMRGVLGMDKVLEMPAMSRPKSSSRSPMPLCFASTRAAWYEFLDGWRAFVAASDRPPIGFVRANWAPPFPRAPSGRRAARDDRRPTLSLRRPDLLAARWPPGRGATSVVESGEANDGDGPAKPMKRPRTAAVRPPRQRSRRAKARATATRRQGNESEK